MNNNKIKKFESPKRLEELDPINTLIKAGLKENMILCDIGAGTGVFSFPATKISNNDIYALEISEDMIEILKKRILERNTSNLIVKKVESEILPLHDRSCHMAIMVTVLHEIQNKEFIINEIKRILKEKGRVMIIEFHKRKTLMGPPVDHRISKEDLKILFKNNGLKIIDEISLGNNFYSVVFEVMGSQ